VGILDLLRPWTPAARTASSALEAARHGDADDGAVTRLVQSLLNTGLDGAGPIDSARRVATRALADHADAERAAAAVVASHVRTGAVGGFATGVGGFVTLPIALPVNVVEFYVQATRMVGAVATLRGYDVDDPTVRTAVMLTLIGSDADKLLERAGLSTGGSRVVALASRRLGPAARLMINKAIGFRLLKTLGEKGFAQVGRAVPLVGGVVGAGFDGYMMKKIGEAATREFPAR
jgi:hypothetical protein